MDLELTKIRLAQTVNEIEKFRLCSPSEDPEVETAVVYGFRHLLQKLIRAARAIRDPELRAEILAIQLPDNLHEVYDAHAALSALFPEIRDEFFFDGELAPESEVGQLKSDKRITGQQLIALKNRIVEGFNESHWRELEVLTDTAPTVTGHHRLLRSLSWHDDDYEGNVLTVLKDIIDAAPDNLAIVLEYVGTKCPAVGEFVSSHNDDARRIVFAPTVFKVPDAHVDQTLISVMMPFEASLTSVYESIKAAAESTGYDCKRADDIWDDSTVVQDIFSLIFESYIVVCDFSGRNPNVFYEAGIARTLGKHVVPITQNPDDVPFDLRHHRYVNYLNNSEGRKALQTEVAGRFKTLAGKRPALPK